MFNEIIALLNSQFCREAQFEFYILQFLVLLNYILKHIFDQNPTFLLLKFSAQYGSPVVFPLISQFQQKNIFSYR